MFTEKNLQQLEKRGITEKDVSLQLDFFTKGFPFMKLVRSASKNDGIVVFDVKQIDDLLAHYQDKTNGRNIIKFVPASGAASRMFKQLCEFREAYKQGEDHVALFAKKDVNSMAYFFENIRQFAFFEDLKNVMERAGKSIEICLELKDYNAVLDALLLENGLDYLNLPKGLLAFHVYANTVRTALEEHLVEGAGYAASEGMVKLHFTVSSEHIDKFKQLVANVLSVYETKFNVKYDISYSVQKPSTDTVAATLDNQLFLTDGGDMVFRPGGHGALIENLNDLKGDLIFIKNIDNVTTDKNRMPTITYKKVIASYLIKLQNKTFEYLKRLEESDISDDVLTEIFHFSWKELLIAFDHFEDLSHDEKRKVLIQKLNRPMRICGMVKNEGEPGGGPFWTENTKGEISLQIVESSQIDPKNLQQQDVLKMASHFNPVDLICGVRNYKGELFDLKQYVDPETGFISEKSMGGKTLKALELPGLWNGAMADWITIFVEVPIAIFSPVKTVNDLLRREHQNV
ncbi:MAG: DUF4301 family protein [Bacteroidales bacterium]|jgi:hypothetical protein|nr:DUF4301 family protein [Bacteroidales bacterium]